MAKENFVLMYGYIKKIETEKLETGRDGELRITLKTIRNPTERYDFPTLFTQNWEMIHQFAADNIKEGDMVSVKGVLRSIRNEDSSVDTVVNLLWIHKMEEQVDEVTAEILLHKNAEVSNNIYIFGTVCVPPRYFEGDDNGRKSMCQFQIASNRKRVLIGDNPNNKTDYLWIKSFGKIAEQMNNALCVKSEIFISGVIQTRNITTDKIDPKTGQYITCEKTVTEIIPYSVEFLRNCNLGCQETDVTEKMKKIDEKVKNLEEKQLKFNRTEYMVRRLCNEILKTANILSEGDDLDVLVRKAYAKICY